MRHLNICPAQLILGFSGLGVVAYRFDRPCDIPVRVAQNACPPDKACFLLSERGCVRFACEDGFASFHPQILRFNLFLRFKGEIYEYGPSFPVKGNRVFVIALAKHIRCLDSGHFFDRLVPRDDCSLIVDHESRIGQEINNIRKSLLRLFERALCGLANADFPVQSLMGNCEFIQCLFDPAQISCHTNAADHLVRPIPQQADGDFETASGPVLFLHTDFIFLDGALTP